MIATVFKWIAFACGLAFVGWIAARTDLGAVATDIVRLGVVGTLVVIAVFYIGFSADVGAWLTMFHSLPLSLRGFGRVWLVQSVGEAVNTLMPFGSLGGEPVKAMVLKRHYGVTYREGTASLLLAAANNTLAEVPFIAIGLAIMLGRKVKVLPPFAQSAMVFGTCLVVVFTIGLFLVLHLRLLAALERRLAAGRWGERLHRSLVAFREIEHRLFTMVRHQPNRFATAVGLSFLTWLSGAVEVLIVLRLLGAHMSWKDAWLVETAVVLARNATFFVPAHIGSQDGVMVLVVGAVTGSPELGLAMALIRRGREIFTSSIGLTIGGWLGFRPGAGARSVARAAR